MEEGEEEGEEGDGFGPSTPCEIAQQIAVAVSAL
jgi:hypothetical protein